MAKENKQSTKPGSTAAPAAKPPKAEKIVYPGLQPGADGKATVKLKEWPEDFDPKLHKGLRPKDFENEAPLLERNAAELEKRAAKLRQQAHDCRTLGNAESRNAAKKLRGMKDKMAEILADLKAKGIDPSQVGLGDLASMFAPAEAAPAEAAPAS